MIRNLLIGRTTCLRWGDIRLCVPQSEPNVFYSTFVAGSYENLRLRKGDVVLDIGAHVGDFSLVASRKVGIEGRVIAIEPNPNLFEILKENIAINISGNVIAKKLAISDSMGIVQMVDEGQASRISADSSDRSFSVNAVTISQLLEDLNIDTVSVIKIDIEGHEFRALDGQPILDHCRSIAVEVHSQALAQQVTDLLRDRGFRIEYLSAKQVTRNSIRNMCTHPFDYAFAEINTGAIGFSAMLRQLSRGTFSGPSTSVIFGHAY